MALSHHQFVTDCWTLAEDMGLPRFRDEFVDVYYLLYLLNRLQDINPAVLAENLKIMAIWTDLAKVGYHQQPLDYYDYRQNPIEYRCAHCGQSLPFQEIEDIDRLVDDFTLDHLLIFQQRILSLPIALKSSQYRQVHYIPNLRICRHNICRYCYDANM